MSYNYRQWQWNFYQRLHSQQVANAAQQAQRGMYYATNPPSSRWSLQSNTREQIRSRPMWENPTAPANDGSMFTGPPEVGVSPLPELDPSVGMGAPAYAVPGVNPNTFTPPRPSPGPLDFADDGSRWVAFAFRRFFPTLSAVMSPTIMADGTLAYDDRNFDYMNDPRLQYEMGTEPVQDLPDAPTWTAGVKYPVAQSPTRSGVELLPRPVTLSHPYSRPYTPVYAPSWAGFQHIPSLDHLTEPEYVLPDQSATGVFNPDRFAAKPQRQELDLVISITPNETIKIERKRSPSTRNVRRRRKDRKVRNKSVAVVRRVVNRLVNGVTETVDMWEALVWNTYWEGTNRPVGNSLSPDMVVKGLLSGQLELDALGAAKSIAFMQIQDAIIGGLSSGTQDGLNRAGWKSPVSFQLGPVL